MTKLNSELYMLSIEIETILYQKTSDEIQMSLEGDIEAINEHEEPWVVEDINVSRETLKLYNLQTGRVYRMHFKELNYLIRHFRIRISNEGLNMKEKIEKEIKELEELYDWNLKKSEDIMYINNWDSIEKRLHDLKIEINTYKKVMEMIINENSIR